MVGREEKRSECREPKSLLLFDVCARCAQNLGTKKFKKKISSFFMAREQKNFSNFRVLSQRRSSGGGGDCEKKRKKKNKQTLQRNLTISQNAIEQKSRTRTFAVSECSQQLPRHAARLSCRRVRTTHSDALDPFHTRHHPLSYNHLTDSPDSSESPSRSQSSHHHDAA